MNLLEFRKDGVYIDGTKIDKITALKIDAAVDDFTEIDIKFIGKVHGLDDLLDKKE